ncbi:MAG: hypothetical protein NC548_33910 [Lachnospiraceae bacterium]|nr:hypothetical protein [Lachnospiraceae bacterium]
MGTQLSQKEQEVLVLEIVDACIKYSKENHLDFANVLEDLVFVGEADTEFSEMVCKTMKSLHDQGYIDGKVKIAYELEFDGETLEESTTDIIDFSNTKFKNISITHKGQELIGEKTFKEFGKKFLEKAKPIIAQITLSEIQDIVKDAIHTALQAIGVPV